MTPQSKVRPAALDFQTAAQVRSLREAGYYVNDICHLLRLHKSAERSGVQREIDAMPRRYQRGIECGGPVRQGRSMARVILP